MKKIDGDITEDAFHRIKAIVGYDEDDVPYDPVKDVNLTFSTQELYDIYNEVHMMLKSGEPHHQIAQQVVGLLKHHVEDRMKKAHARKEGKSTVFRRVG